MKRLALVVGIVLGWSAVALGDTVDELLPDSVGRELKAEIRQMIRAGVESKAAVDLTRSMVRQGFSTEDALKAQRIVTEAAEGGLPAGPIINKAYEGMAKQVGGRQIVRAMETVRNRYQFARDQAGSLGLKPEIVRSLGDLLSGGLTAGMAHADMERIVTSLRMRMSIRSDSADNQALALESFRTARNMTRLGAASGTVADVVTGALNNGYDARRMVRLGQTFSTQARQGSPDSIAGQYDRAIREGRSPGADAGSGGAEGGRGGKGPGDTGGGNSGGSGSSGGGGSGGKGGNSR